MLVHNGVQPDGSNVLTKDIRRNPIPDQDTIAMLEALADDADAFRAAVRTMRSAARRNGPARDDMRILAGAQCFCSQTRGQKIRN